MASASAAISRIIEQNSSRGAPSFWKSPATALQYSPAAPIGDT